MIPAATKTPGAQLPVASRRMPLTTGLAALVARDLDSEE